MRPCIICGTLTHRRPARCDNHQLTPRTNQERLRRARAVRAHIETHGHICFGWGVPPHPATDLTADHLIPRAAGGENGPLGVLCRSCNSRRGDRPFDRG